MRLEARGHTEEILRDSKEFCSTLLHNSPNPIIVINLDASIGYVNHALEEQTGFSAEDLVGKKPPYPWWREDLLQQFLHSLERIRQTGAGANRSEMLFRKRDGELFWVEICTALVGSDSGDEFYLGIWTDITERKCVEQALRESEDTARALLNAVTDSAMLIDLGGNILAINKIGVRRLGSSVDELLGSHLFDFLPPALAESRKERIARAMCLGKTLHFEDECNGVVFDNSVCPVFDAQGRMVRLAFFERDITDRKQVEKKIRSYQEQLQSLASELSLTEERERRRIATDLHDCVGQILAICKVKLAAALKSVSSTPLAAHLNEIRELIDQTIQYTRSLTFELSPPILYELGFEAAVEWLAEQIQEEHGVRVEFVDDGHPKPIDEEIRVLLFKAVRELLFNVAKHAQARKAKISLLRAGNDIRIDVEDDGVGFDVSETITNLGETNGYGLFNLRERLSHVGGYFQIESKPRHGTHATLVVPIKVKKKSTTKK